jgi:DNA adenine methylase Dam
MTDIIFLGTGPTAGVKRENEIRTNSSVIITKEDKKLLVDCTPDFLTQINREGINDIDAVILTHAHKDAIGGLDDLDKWTSHRLFIFAPPRVLSNERIDKKFNNLVIVPLSPYKSTKIENFKITPFRVIHYEYHPTLGSKFPSYGYLIDNIAYAEDMELLPANAEKYFASADVIIIDAAMWFDKQIRGHLDVQKSINLLEKFKPSLGILIQAGNTYPAQEQAEEEIEKYLESNDIQTDVILSYDGLKLDLDKELEEVELGAFGSPGGKSHILRKLISRIPEHKTYIEPYAGGAALFWNKDPVGKEILNDIDSEIAFAYNFIKNVTPEQVEELKKKDWSSSKEKFFEIKDSEIASNPVERFYNFYYLYGWSYGGNRSTFGYLKAMRHADICNQLLTLKERLKNTDIYCKDAVDVIKNHDSSDAFIYLDPPYPGEWAGKTGTNTFTKEDCQKLHDTLKKCRSKFLLSINNLSWLKDIFSDFKIVKIKVPRMFRADRINKKWSAPKYELLIYNYDFEESNKLLDEELAETGSGDVGGSPIIGGGLQPIVIARIKKRKKISDSFIKFCENDILYDAELIKDIQNYDPSKINNDVLSDDWRIVNAWYSTYKQTNGEGIKFSKEDIINLARLIYNEIIERVKSNKMIHSFEPYKMNDNSKELFTIVSKDKLLELKEITEDLDKLDPFLDNFKQAILVKDFISLVGSQVKRQENQDPNDYDIHIRMDREKIGDYLERAIKVRMIKMIGGNTELADKLHIFAGDASGGHDSFIPLYDLVLVPTERKIINMMERDSEIIDHLHNLESKKKLDIVPYIPQKPQGSAFYEIDELLEKIDPEKIYSVEYKFNGFHAIVIKKDNEVKIYSEQKKDLTKAFPTLSEEIKKLSKSDFAIDGELVPYDENGKALGRNELMKYIGKIRRQNEE